MSAEIRLLTRKDMARILKMSLNTLDAHVDKGHLPRPRPFPGGRLGYVREEDFQAAVKALFPPVDEKQFAPVPVPSTSPPPAPVPRRAKHGRSQQRGSAVDRARRRDAEQLAKMNS
jgi:predicted DNA-binding transcriptional regulator AlpA